MTKTILSACAATITLFCTTNAQGAESKTLKNLEINCIAAEHLGDKWGATCTNSASDIQITGIAKCSFIPGQNGTYSQSDTINTDPDEDNIYCWCQIANPFISPNVYINEYLYQTECENWCANFCAQSATGNQKFRDAIFSNLKPGK